MFTQKEIAETNQKVEQRLKQDALLEIKRAFPGQETFTLEQVASMFPVLSAKIIFVPQGTKLGMKQ